jgi:hypothetical protein
MRGILSFFGDLLGLQFLEVPPDLQRSQAVVAKYLENQNLKERDAALDMFHVFDITGFTPRPLGFFILDV